MTSETTHHSSCHERPYLVRLRPSEWPLGTRWLLLSFTAVYALQFLVAAASPRWEVLIFHRIHDYPVIFWGYFTSIFSHDVSDPVGHFGFNAFAIWAMGLYLEPNMGTRTFVWLFFVGGVVSGIVSAFLEPATISVGASGGATALLGYLVMMKPYYPKGLEAVYDWLYPLMAAALWLALFSMARGGLGASEEVNHIAHLVGFTGGIVYAWGHPPKVRMQDRPLSGREAARKPTMAPEVKQQ